MSQKTTRYGDGSFRPEGITTGRPDRDVAPPIGLEDPHTGAAVSAPPSTPCVQAGPKYRALDGGDGIVSASSIDRNDLVTLADTLLGAVVYVQDPSDGTIPALFRLRKVVSGRPNRASGAPGTPS